VRASSTGARVAIGKVRNDASRDIRVTTPQVKVVDADGRRIRSTAVFASAFVRSKYPHNAISQAQPSEYPEAEQKRVGYLAVLGSGEETALTVSWTEPRGRRAAKRIVLGPGSLPIPDAVSAVR
jgi:hypothetical protein